MRNFYGNLERWKAMPLALALLLLSPQQEAQAVCNEKNGVEATQQAAIRIVGAVQINPTTVEILFSNNQRMTLDFYGENIFRMFQDNAGVSFVIPKLSRKQKFWWASHVNLL